MKNKINRTDEIKRILGLEELSPLKAGVIRGGKEVTKEVGSPKKKKDEEEKDIDIDIEI